MVVTVIIIIYFDSRNKKKDDRHFSKLAGRNMTPSAQSWITRDSIVSEEGCHKLLGSKSNES
jgi:hypothetical protein